MRGKVPQEGNLAQGPAGEDDLVEHARDELDRDRLARNVVLGRDDEAVGALAEF